MTRKSIRRRIRPGSRSIWKRRELNRKKEEKAKNFGWTGEGGRKSVGGAIGAGEGGGRGAAERAESERLECERLEMERLEGERLEAERLEQDAAREA